MRRLEKFDRVLCRENHAINFSTTDCDGYREFKAGSILKNCPLKMNALFILISGFGIAVSDSIFQIFSD